jgi:hypothetical protein
MIRYDNTALWAHLRGWRIIYPGIDLPVLEVAREALQSESVEAYADESGWPLALVQEAVAWARAAWTQEDGDQVVAILTEATGVEWAWSGDEDFFAHLPTGVACVCPCYFTRGDEVLPPRLDRWCAGWDRDDRADSGNGTEYGESAGFEHLIALAQEAIDRVNAEPEEEDET